jgi:hypothetical protein
MAASGCAGESLVRVWAGPRSWGFKFPFFFPSRSELKIKSENASNSLYFNKTLNFILNSDLRKLHNFEQLDDTTPTMVLDFPYDLWI